MTSITGRHYFCSESCKEKDVWQRERQRPEVVLASRERSRSWAAANRSVRKSNPWLVGAPPYAQYLPGGAMAISVTPQPKWPVELRNTRALHGLTTEILGRPHDPTLPGFVLIPTDLGAIGWGVYVPRDDAALLACKSVGGVLFDRDVMVRFGPMHRLKAPQVTKRGRRRLRVDCITPVCIRSDHSTVTRIVVTSGSLCSTMSAWLPRRLGITLAPDAIKLVIVDKQITTETVPMGGKYGVAKGFIGHLIVETNAVGEWLLRAAESIGLGGRTAFGFGRIRVSGLG